MPRLSPLTIRERGERGAQTINGYLDSEPNLGEGEAATDAIVDILHAYVEPGDQEAAEQMVRMAVTHFLSECDEQRGRR